MRQYCKHTDLISLQVGTSEKLRILNLKKTSKVRRNYSYFVKGELNNRTEVVVGT